MRSDQNTVNLRQKQGGQNDRLGSFGAGKGISNTQVQGNPNQDAEQGKDALDEFYAPERVGSSPLKKIERAPTLEGHEKKIKLAVAAAGILVLAMVLFFAFKAKIPTGKVAGEIEAVSQEAKWYAVKLVDGEIFFGQTSDTATNPLTIEKVYYNYDQSKDGAKTDESSPNLRLVKRGKETHGPTGEMKIYQAQILYLEPLKDDSKVLGAIREYEK
jgi:hypothetical protein